MIDPRIAEYETRHQCRLLETLNPGPGQDGIVMFSDRHTAVKFFDRPDRFHREHDVYEVVYHVLHSKGKSDIGGHNVPRMIAADFDLHAIEMTIVERPFVLDFAGAKLPEEVPDFEEHVMEEHYEHLRELFGDRWGDALHVADLFLDVTGYTLLDIHPGNIAFDDRA